MTANVSLISANDPAPDEGTVDQWTLGDLLPGEGGTVSVRVRVEGGSLLTTRAVIESDRAAASAEVTTTVESSYGDRFATREILVAGTVSGTYLDTHALDGGEGRQSSSAAQRAARRSATAIWSISGSSTSSPQQA